MTDIMFGLTTIPSIAIKIASYPSPAPNPYQTITLEYPYKYHYPYISRILSPLLPTQ